MAISKQYSYTVTLYNLFMPQCMPSTHTDEALKKSFKKLMPNIVQYKGVHSFRLDGTSFR